MRAFSLTTFFLAATIAGCGSPALNLPPAPPHGGTAFALPEAKGFVEVLRQEVPDQSGKTQLLIYFLDPAGKTLGTAVTAVSFLPKARGADAVVLKPTGDADAAKATGMASAPFPDPGEIAGVLTATVDEKSVSVAISIR